MKKLLAAWAVVAIVIGCGSGSGSGVDPNKRAVDLTDAEIADVCGYLATLGRVVTCDGVEIDFTQTVQECIDGATEAAEENPDCDLTVGQVEACAEAIDALSDDAICNDEALPAVCEPQFAPECI